MMPEQYCAQYVEASKQIADGLTQAGIQLGEHLKPLLDAMQPLFNAMDAAIKAQYPYYWRVKTRFPERFKTPCKVLTRGKRNNCLVQFMDGFRIITSRNYIRRWK